ncbi:DUF6701 domain-containing protein [Vibrio sp. PID17_43]|uniref:DUF6701 domain-containing protein n=1 Tax=Vibrio sp. PID17_43 TaxID=1583451 RepID=UPI000BFFDA3E|nr:DUF6701 domain-containing protein [Vibrio sp. PID17_43]PHJ40585.1 polymer-forming cytoskeletal family protein [Vibrio sp. PID17_43]
MKLLHTFMALLAVLPFAVGAKVYDLATITAWDSVEFCESKNMSIYEDTMHGVIYYCPASITLKNGDSIINSVDEKSLLKASSKVTFEGNNTVGSESSSVSIATESPTAGGIFFRNDEQSRSSIYGSMDSPRDISLTNITVVGSIKTTDGFVNITGVDNIIDGSVTAQKQVEMHDVTIYGDVTSGGSGIEILGEQNYIEGSLNALSHLSITNTLVGGSVTSGGAITVDGEGNIINGDVTSLHNTLLHNTAVCGNVKSDGVSFYSESASNVIVGNILTKQNIELQNTEVFGFMASEGGSVSLDSSFLYANKVAVNVFQQATVNGTGVVCGDITAYSIDSAITRYCGIDEPNCTYASNACPEIDVPVCEIKPPSEDDFELVVSPHDDMALMCGDTLPQFTVTTTNNGKPASAKVTAALSHPRLFTLKVLEGEQDGDSYLSTNEGTLLLEVIPKNIKQLELGATYTLTFTMTDDLEKTQTVRFMFKPFMFEAYSKDRSTSVDEITVIAGKSQIVNTRLLACSATGEQIIATNYDGVPTVTNKVIKPANGQNGHFTYSADFTDGESSHGLITNESGLFNVTLSDTFTCEGYQECPDEGVVKVTGTFDVKSRPWTLAICDGSHPLTAGTADSGEGFIAAGEEFSVTVKPIIWQSGGSLAGPVDTHRYCNAEVTRNFMLEDAPAASIVLSSQQETPIQTAAGQSRLLKSTQGLVKSHTDTTDNAYTFSQLYWEEVGSLRVKTNLSGQYLGLTVNEGYRDIGRFYAKYFKAHNVDWTYPTNQDFVYMNQPLEKISYDVVALNAKKQNILNYIHFAPHLREHFNLGELSSYSDRFIPPRSTQGEWNKVGNASIGTFTVAKAASSATCLNSPCWEKDETDGQYPDGPFNHANNVSVSKIGLTYDETNVVDTIHFFDGQHVFDKQPDARFGRLNFKDVGGNQGMTIRVPLDVEVWKNGRFVTHFNDNATTVNGEHYTRTPIWSNSSADNTLLTGSGTMLAGRTYGIVANQIDSAREQVRFHLDLSIAGNNLPWLKYNWDKNSIEEDNPPTVVTFGIHRGNDRIIYRGEPNFIGMTR